MWTEVNQVRAEDLLGVFPNAMLDNKVDPPLSNDPALETYIAGPENGEPPYTGGPSRIVMTSDGTQGCLALLLFRDMILSINKALLGSNKVERLQKEIDALDTEISFAEVSLRQYPSLIEALPEIPGKADEEAKIRTMTEESREQYRHTASFKESLRGILSREKFNLRSSGNKIQENIQRVLFESRLLEVEDQSAEMKQRQSKPSETEEPQRYVSSIKALRRL